MNGYRPERRCNGRNSTARGPWWLWAVMALLMASLGADSAWGQPQADRQRAQDRARLARSIEQTSGLFPADDPQTPDGPSPRPSLTGRDEIAALQEPLAGVAIEGNRTIPTEEIARRLKSRAGRTPTPEQVKEDVRSLYTSRWFFSVETQVRRTPEGPVLVFKVVERPILASVEFKGITGTPWNKKRELRELADLTGLKSGAAYDVGANKEAAQRIERHYREKGFMYAKVTIEKGESPDDREVVFHIDKGPKVHVDKVSFEGNHFFSDAQLKTQLKTKTRFLYLLGGKYDPSTVPEDVAALKQYYHSVGFFDVKISEEQSVTDNRASVKIAYQIEEGPRYKVRGIEFQGIRVLAEETLRDGMKLKAGDYFNERMLSRDVEGLLGKYGKLGRIFATVNPAPRFLEEPGTLDVVFQVDEDRPYKIGRVRVHILGDHPHTRESVVLNRLPFRTGDLASRDAIKKGEQRLAGSQVFAGATPNSPDRPRISVAPAEPKNQPRQKKPTVDLARGQSPGIATRRGQSADAELLAQGTMFEGAPLGPMGPSVFENDIPGYIDADVYGTETQTGRLMFGVGVNSNQGLVGSFVLEENNFDIFRAPRNFQDLVDGAAFRGGGQQLRIEAVPGTQLSRYLISWRDPYFLDQNISAGGSFFYYTRFFPNWNERRLGGRISAGHQFTPEWSGSVSLRLEGVELTDPSIPIPKTLAEALGNSFLSTVRANLVHDTRDSPFLPGSGHYIELAYEQGFGEWVYPRAEFEARQYYTVYERPAGGGRHIVSTTFQVGWTDNGTPIFEKFYAGGFQSFRGFAFYGVTPRETGVRVGGRWQALGSAEYLFPVTADDMIQLVAFTDFGTVEDRVAFDDFRLSVGGGVRLTIPAMGPVPIALDFGFPILKQDFDSKQIFNFYVGLLR
jgi:outer membrane protein insertion porin family